MNMSDVQRFLLTIDNDPKDAAHIYESTAKSQSVEESLNM